MKKKLLLSLADQIVVSGGNFLTIILGAQILPLTQQGKLAYVISAYMVTVFINVAAIFSVAPAIKYEAKHPLEYKMLLTLAQLLLAAASTGLIIIAMHIFGTRIGWEISLPEGCVLALFLVLQQISDFRRRTAYVFDDIQNAVLTSIWAYGLRILLILTFHPDTILGVLVIFVISASPSTIAVAITLTKTHPFQTLYRSDTKNLVFLHCRRSLWTSLNAPLSWVTTYLPIFMLGAIESEKSAAILLSIRSIGSVANVAFELLETFIPNWLANRASIDGRQGLRYASTKLLAIGGALWLIGLFAIILSDRLLISFFLGNEYNSYSTLLTISWFGNGIHFVSRIISLHYRTSKNTQVEFIGSIGGLFSLALIPILVDSFGINGAASVYIFIPTFTIIFQRIFISTTGNRT